MEIDIVGRVKPIRYNLKAQFLQDLIAKFFWTVLFSRTVNLNTPIRLIKI